MTEPYMPDMLEGTLDSVLEMITSDTNLDDADIVDILDMQKQAVLGWYDAAREAFGG